ncbi:MAG: hypothetical protein BRD48_00035 [Bacteroidetes bacterium QS_9_68_14]|nr:MAG: hypothetical protein BRD48_00035 [Bacteroidetes bacterium QS_9_68_14]
MANGGLPLEDEESGVPYDEGDSYAAQVGADYNIIPSLAPGAALTYRYRTGGFPGNAFEPGQPFGPLFALDGVPPSGRAHRLVAEAAAEIINEGHEGANLPVNGN